MVVRNAKPKKARKRCGVTPEGAVKATIQQYLTIKGIYWKRNQVGVATFGKYRVPFGNKGEADLTAYVQHPAAKDAFYILHIECKAGKNTLSPWQLAEQRAVESLGHKYLVAYSVEDVMQALAALGVKP